MGLRDATRWGSRGRRLVALLVVVLAVPRLDPARHDPACPHHLGASAVADHDHPGPHDDASGEDSTHGGCTCAGSCVVGVSHPGIAAAAVTAAVPMPTEAVGPSHPSEAPPRRAVRYLLPYANAPPGTPRV